MATSSILTIERGNKKEFKVTDLVRYKDKQVVFITSIDSSTPYFAGTVVYSPDDIKGSRLGFHSTQWWVADFEPFEGSITLTQK